MWEKAWNNPHNEAVWKREAHKQKLEETDDELPSTSAKRDCGEKAKGINIDVDYDTR